MITKEISEHLTRLILSEEKRLVKLAVKLQRQNDFDEKETNGYIVGIGRLASNLRLVIKDQVDYSGPVCWRCGMILVTKQEKDDEGLPVQVCSNCGSIVYELR